MNEQEIASRALLHVPNVHAVNGHQLATNTRWNPSVIRLGQAQEGQPNEQRDQGTYDYLEDALHHDAGHSNQHRVDLRIKVSCFSQRHRGRRGGGEREGLDTAQPQSFLLIRSLCPLCLCGDEGTREARGAGRVAGPPEAPEGG